MKDLVASRRIRHIAERRLQGRTAVERDVLDLGGAREAGVRLADRADELEGRPLKVARPGLGDAGFDTAAFADDVRTLVRALDACHEPNARSREIAIRLEGLAALLMRLGLGYDSAEGRNVAASVAALAHAAAISESSALAQECGASAERVEVSLKAARAAVGQLAGDIAAAAAELYRRVPAKAALRAPVAIAFAADRASARRLGQHAPGLAPSAGAAVYGVREDGGFGRILCDDARAGLRELGYDDDAMAGIRLHAEGRRTLKGAPGVNHETLAQRGLTEPAIEAVEEAAFDAFTLRDAVHPLVIGPEFCESVLKLPADVAAGKRGDFLLTLGFTEAEIAAAERFCMGQIHSWKN